jgi:hypothetical protein
MFPRSNMNPKNSQYAWLQPSQVILDLLSLLLSKASVSLSNSNVNHMSKGVLGM